MVAICVDSYVSWDNVRWYNERVVEAEAEAYNTYASLMGLKALKWEGCGLSFVFMLPMGNPLPSKN